MRALEINLCISFYSCSFTVPKKETTEFTREIAQKTEINSLKTGVIRRACNFSTLCYLTLISFYIPF